MTATETSAVAWGGTELPYTIRRSTRRNDFDTIFRW